MIVIPMAGLSSRFANAGYDAPKFMLDLEGRTLFAHAIASFEAYFSTEPFLFIAREAPGVADFIASELKKLDVAQFKLIMLPRPTLGQADTVRLGLTESGTTSDTPLTIFNIDTFRPGFTYPRTDWFDHADAYLEVMPGDDPGFSYALPIEGAGDSRVARTAEKQVISNLASTGLYWFRRAGDFTDALQASETTNGNGELYIAPLYNNLISKGLDVRYHLIAESEVIFCGTPAQYEGLLAEQRTE